MAVIEDKAHGQTNGYVLSSGMVWTVDRLNKLNAKNLRKLVDGSGLKKEDFADRIGIGPDYLSQLINERTAIGKETMMKICNAFNVHPGYFDREDDIVAEDEAVYKVREARKYGVEDQVRVVTDAIIEQAKKKSGSASADADRRPQRTRKKAI